MPFSIWCWFNRHRPLRREVEWTQAGYVGHCQYCGKTIRRKRSGQWQRFRKSDD